MENYFKIEIISPEKIIFSDNVNMVTLPSYEGDMGILKDHISIITFLRPGIIKVEKSDKKYENFFVEDGTVEYFNNNLVILSSSAKNLKDLSKTILEELDKTSREKLAQKDISDHDRYILNQKIDVIKEIRI
tara:strand:- start:8614 stop:9009 length:396 start_codon:yes stop_codon:yes gene_type:complete